MTRKSSEFARIALIEKVLSKARVGAPAIELGIGDDAAVLRATGRLVWTIDAHVEGVHFRREWLTWEDVGYRSFQAAVSDLGAMAARPVGAVANLGLPPAFSDRNLEALARGQALAAVECGCPLVGGNVSKGSEVSIATSALGSVKKPVLRSGARPGDELWLGGDVGMASFGLALLSGRASRSRSAAARRCIERWQRPRAQIATGQKLAERAHALIDVSDGLAGDAAHVAEKSGVRVVIDESALRAALSAELVDAAEGAGLDPLTFALYGGEDYALLAAGPPGRRPRDVVAIGSIERGSGVVLRRGDGTRAALGRGHDHFAR